MRKINNKLEEKVKSRLRETVLFPDTSNVYVNGVRVPSCFGRRDSHVRVPVKSEGEIEGLVKRITQCSTCWLLESCTSGTLIDINNRILMFNRFIFEELRALRDDIQKIAKQSK